MQPPFRKHSRNYSRNRIRENAEQIIDELFFGYFHSQAQLPGAAGTRSRDNSFLAAKHNNYVNGDLDLA